MAIFNSFLYVYQRVSVVLQSYLSIVVHSSKLLCSFPGELRSREAALVIVDSPNETLMVVNSE